LIFFYLRENYFPDKKNNNTPSMKHLSFPLLAFGLTLLFTSCQKSEPTNERVILIGIDGFGTEGYLQAKHPNIDSLFADGVISLNTRTVMPSVTMPNWTSHLTGAGPEQHGVFNNGWEKNEHPLDPQEMDEEGYFPSIFKVLKDEMPSAKTAYYYNWANLIKPINQRYLDEVKFAENDGYAENYQAAFEFLKANQNDPSLIFLYTVHVDHAGHSFQWLSDEYITAIEELDVQIGKFVGKLKEGGLYEDSHILLFTDHGGVGSGHGGTSVTEMEVPWMIRGPKIQKGKKLTTPNSNTNTAVVISKIFGIESPYESWIGRVPSGVFVE
jgi:predicted AlkP superfamily pyrophosphatase or phosphodiesterase